MTLRRPTVRINGVFKELPAGDTLPTVIPAAGAAGQVLAKNSASDYDLVWATPNAYKLIATTGDLSANPVAAITFSNLGVYSDVIFDFAGVGHDQSTGQSFSAAFSLDGSTFVSPVVISPSISTASAIHGEANIAPSLTGRPLMRCGLGSGSIQSAQWTNATENPRVAIAGSPILAMRFTPSTAGNFNKGVVTAYGR